MLRLAILFLLGLLPWLTLPPAVRAGTGFAPASFYGLPAPPLRGPDQAAGLIIWNHGYGAHAYIEQAPPLAWYFAQAGWDVYRQYRSLKNDSGFRAAAAVEQAVEKAQALGYRRIVLMGFSMGAYAAVDVAQRRPVAGVIALAPATVAHHSFGWELNDHAMRPMWRQLGALPQPLVAAYFPQDIFYETEMPAVRGPWLRQQLGHAAAPHLVIDRPQLPGIVGHSAGLGWSFARRYGPCIRHLIDSTAADSRTPDCTGLRDDRAFTAAAISAQAKQLLRPYQGRWRGQPGKHWGFSMEIGLDDLGVPLMTLTLPEQGTLDLPLVATAGGWRGEAEFGLLDLRRTGDTLAARITRPGDSASDRSFVFQRDAPSTPHLAGPQLELADQPLSSTGLKSSATPLMQ